MKSTKKVQAKTKGGGRVPKELDVRGQRWQVHYKWGLRDEDGELCDGLCDAKNRKIWLSHGLGDDKFEIFMHEYVHAILAEVGLYHTSLTKDQEEAICHNVGADIVKQFILRKRPQK